jgi:isoleucyl-tRNA synthetase
MARLGPRLGKAAGKVPPALAALNPADVAAAMAGDGLTLSLDDDEVHLADDDVVVERVWPDTLAGAETPVFSLALETELTDELIAEGIARDVVRHVQQLRKDANLEMNARIHLRYDGDDTTAAAVETWADYIRAETLALDIARGLLDEPDRIAKVGTAQIKLAICEDKA